MKKLLTVLLPAIMILPGFAMGAGPDKQLQSLGFTENKGQVSDQYSKPRPDVLFSGQADGLVYHLKQQGISYQAKQG